MITKQQTLEFIDELSNQTNVYINLERGKMYADVYVDYEEGITGTYTADIGFKPQSYELPLLEELVTEFIKVNQDSNLLNNFDKFPVDINMLEVGQTYKVYIQKDWDHGFFTAKFLGFDEEDDYIVKFENNKPYTKFDIIEIYKVNEHTKHVVLEDTVACSDYEETEDCIIVDGVDVSDCKFFNAKYKGCHCYNTKKECYAINPNEHHSCEGTNCCYKKYKKEMSNNHEFKRT